ncbi:MAG: lipase family protein [Gammaproteobacteria bacterium]|nr:lipase family protein [Gammaproteobacteria bacterium]
MEIQYTTSINGTDKEKVLLLIEASLQAYNAFNDDDPEKCQKKEIVAPAGFDCVECWTGIDAIFNHDKTVECYGVVFRSHLAPYTYIFAFRGTSSILDMLDDLGAESTSFTPYEKSVEIPSGVTVESGFYDVYSSARKNIPSMQSQLFQLIDKYEASDKPIDQLYITGHSLGSALSELFTLDVALSRPSITASNINYACPRVGNRDFVTFYEQQAAQQNNNTRTLRVQNTYDKVPCVPLEDMGYQHLSYACIIAFYKDSWIGKADLLACHSALNYQAVLKCAAENEQGICVCKKLNVPGNDYAVTSKKPEKSTICSFW